MKKVQMGNSMFEDIRSAMKYVRELPRNARRNGSEPELEGSKLVWRHRMREAVAQSRTSVCGALVLRSATLLQEGRGLKIKMKYAQQVQDGGGR